MSEFHGDPVRYWDACAFLAILNEEPEIDSCREVIAEGMVGKTKIVTSTLTLAEVLHTKGYYRLPTEKHQEVVDVFKHSFIVVRPVTRYTAEFAREICWYNPVDPKDAIHLATAISEPRLRLFETKDAPLLKFGKLHIAGHDPLEIDKPWWNAPRLPGT